MITVVCWLWDGWRPRYTEGHVRTLRNMLRRNLDTPHRFVCITDRPSIEGVETLPLWGWGAVAQVRGVPNCYRRLRLFSGDVLEELGPSVISVDLDCIVLGDVTGVFEELARHDFAALEGVRCPYNGSLWHVRPGANPQVWDDLDEQDAARALQERMPNGRPYYGSDQAYMSYKLPGRPTVGESEGVLQYLQLGAVVPQDARMIFFAGDRKPWDTQFNRLYEFYERA